MGDALLTYWDNLIVYPDKKKGILYEDIGGLGKQIEEIEEVIEYPLKFPEKMARFGIEAATGILLGGPPGSGKTLLAKAVATEARSPFVTLSGNQFIKKYIGEGGSLARELYKKARELAKEHGRCIVFIDQIEAIGRQREATASSGDREVQATLSQLLIELDGIAASRKKHLKKTNLTSFLKYRVDELLKLSETTFKDTKQQLTETMSILEECLTNLEARPKRKITPQMEEYMYVSSVADGVVSGAYYGEKQKENFEALCKAAGIKKTVKEIYEDNNNAIKALLTLRTGGLPKYGETFDTKRLLIDIIALSKAMKNLKEDKGIVITMGATDRPDCLDTALLRPGRFDKLIKIPLPDYKGRCEILYIYCEDKPFTSDITDKTNSKDHIVSLIGSDSYTGGLSGAEIRELCNKAATLALQKHNKMSRADEVVKLEDFVEARNYIFDTRRARKSKTPQRLYG